MIKHLVTGILTLSLALSGSGYGWANGLSIHNIYTSKVATQERISAPRSFTIKYNKLSWQPPLYKGRTGKLIYVVEIGTFEGWAVLGTTTSTIYKLPSGGESLYRVYAKNSETRGVVTKPLKNTGARGANLITVPTNAPAPAVGEIFVSQRGGAGSSVVDVSWTEIPGALKYDIETSIVGSDVSLLVRSTSASRAMLVIKAGIPVQIDVYASLSSASRTLLSSHTYVGSK